MRSRDCLFGNTIAEYHSWLNSYQVIRHPIFRFAPPGDPKFGSSGISPTNIQLESKGSSSFRVEFDSENPS